MLATVFGANAVSHIFNAANFVSQGDYYKALSELRHVLRHGRAAVAAGRTGPSQCLVGRGDLAQ